MKRLKKWTLVLTLASPTLFAFSCSSTWVREFRDAAVDGAASYVEQATYDLLDYYINVFEEEEE